MTPIVTPAEMAAVDAEASESVDVLIARAGAAVARAALEMLGGAYGRRVIVVAGKGNNGRDGIEAASRLRRRGAVVDVLDATSAPAVLPPADLVIDAAYGTGMRGSYSAPDPGGAPVLSVDIPSGLDGLTGESSGHPPHAARTVTFAALKPGLLFGDGPACAGQVTVADIGLDVSRARAVLCDESDIAAMVPTRHRDAHKWQQAVWVVAGSPLMTGAAALCATAAARAGASYVRVSLPGVADASALPLEAVRVSVPLIGWDRVVLADLDRIAAVAVGPGLGRSDAVRDSVSALAQHAAVPVVIDGDGLWAIASLSGPLSYSPRVLTPHDGEYVQLAGHPPGVDRIRAARELAANRGAVVLLKGPTTVVAEPSGRVRLVTAGDERLATAGTGDTLTGIIVALLARGADAFDAAAAGALVHGLAARRCHRVGMIASDLLDPIAEVLSTDALSPRQ